MPNIRLTNIQSAPRISLSRSALLATIGDKPKVVTRLGALHAGLTVARDIAGASAGRVTTFEGAEAEIRDLICRLRGRLLQTRTTARHAELVGARTTVGNILSGLIPS